MTVLAITAEQVATNGKAWVDAIIAILTSVIGGVGVLALAAVAVYQNIKKAIPQEVTDRLNRYNDRLDRVAIATVAAAPEDKKLEVAAAVARAPVPSDLPANPFAGTGVTASPPEVVIANKEPISVTEAPKPEDAGDTPATTRKS